MTTKAQLSFIEAQIRTAWRCAKRADDTACSLAIVNPSADLFMICIDLERIVDRIAKHGVKRALEYHWEPASQR